jgi:hypothetical protein
LNIQWSAIIAGAIGASALAFVLHTFAGAIGLSVSSAAGDIWRPSASLAGENIIAYDLDRLFRGERRPQGVDASISYPRSEAARILLTTSSHRGMQAEDRAYLVRLVTAMTGLAPPDAERRVAEVIARAQENIARARATVVILGFMVGAAALLGAVAAWFAACAGGRQRDGRETLHPLWDWSRPVSRA